MAKDSIRKMFHRTRKSLDPTTRQTWFQQGDKNNRYFQRVGTIRKRQNTI